MKKYEYEFMAVDMPKAHIDKLKNKPNANMDSIKKMGEEGWEMVSCVSTIGNTVYCFFKRESDNRF